MRGRDSSFVSTPVEGRGRSEVPLEGREEVQGAYEGKGRCHVPLEETGEVKVN